MTIGIIREGKTPPDKRVPLSPLQCEQILNDYPQVELFVQKSEIRKFTDSEYERAGIAVVDSVDHCDVLLGVKEVPKNELTKDTVSNFEVIEFRYPDQERFDRGAYQHNFDCEAMIVSDLQV